MFSGHTGSVTMIKRVLPAALLKNEGKDLCREDKMEENIGREISDIPHSNIFTDMSPKARDIKERINKWDSSN